MTLALNYYQDFLAKVQKIIQETERDIIQTVNREKVEMCWQIGKTIDEHLLKNNRADYGKKLFSTLAKDISIAEKTLYQMRSFYKAYPILPKRENGLNWTHYRNLISVKDEEKRKYLEDLTLSKGLGVNALQREISKSKPRPQKTNPQINLVKKLSVTRGKVFTYKLAKFSDSSASFVDCGFKVFSEIKTSFKNEGEIFESVKKSEAFGLKKSSATTKEIYTYKAILDRVVDGDTIKVTLDLGFKIRHQEILRLAKINAPEASTSAGKKATKALEDILKDVPFLIIKTNKTDIYGRYIADVFLAEKSETNPQKTADSGIYLNQILLEQGLVDLF
jgi:endonuclease YncB( thermonuclease family)